MGFRIDEHPVRKYLDRDHLLSADIIRCGLCSNLRAREITARPWARRQCTLTSLIGRLCAMTPPKNRLRQDGPQMLRDTIKFRGHDRLPVLACNRPAAIACLPRCNIEWYLP